MGGCSGDPTQQLLPPHWLPHQGLLAHLPATPISSLDPAKWNLETHFIYVVHILIVWLLLREIVIRRK